MHRSEETGPLRHLRIVQTEHMTAGRVRRDHASRSGQHLQPRDELVARLTRAEHIHRSRGSPSWPHPVWTEAGLGSLGSAACPDPLPPGRTEVNVDARRVMRNGLPFRCWQAGGGEEVLIELVDLHTPQRPRLMLHRNVY